jgi:hypothetical protein
MMVIYCAFAMTATATLGKFAMRCLIFERNSIHIIKQQQRAALDLL